jgi:hypothetical protein
LLSFFYIFLLQTFSTPLEYLQNAFEWIAQQIQELLGKIPGLDNGLKGFKAQSFAEIAKERKDSGGVEFFTQGNTLAEMNDGMNLFWDQQTQTLKEKWGDYSTVVQGFVARAPKSKTEHAAKVAGKNLDDAKSDMPKAEFTSLEKMGFAMGGLNNPAIEHQRNTATNTGRLVQMAEQFLNNSHNSPPIDGTV